MRKLGLILAVAVLAAPLAAWTTSDSGPRRWRADEGPEAWPVAC